VTETATREFVHNLHELPHTVKDAYFRLGKAPESEREESQATIFFCTSTACACTYARLNPRSPSDSA